MKNSLELLKNIEKASIVPYIILKLILDLAYYMVPGALLEAILYAELEVGPNNQEMKPTVSPITPTKI